MCNKIIKKERKEYKYGYNININSKVKNICLGRDKKEALFRLKISNSKNKLLRRVNETKIKKEFLDLLNNIPRCSANKEPRITNSSTIFSILSLFILGSGLFYCSKKLVQKYIIKNKGGKNGKRKIKFE